MPRRITEQQVRDLEAKIKAINERAECKKIRANPAVKSMATDLLDLQ
jgi:hypothetical protein